MRKQTRVDSGKIFTANVVTRSDFNALSIDSGGLSGGGRALYQMGRDQSPS